MSKKDKKNSTVIIRYNPSIEEGLNDDQVKRRFKDKLNNKTTYTVGKSYIKIVFDNVLTIFNIIYFIIAALLIYGGYYSSLLFLFVIIPNMLIGLYEDISARRLMDKLHVITAPKAKVIRDSNESLIPVDDIVLDDIVKMNSSDQISADCVLLKGNLGVNESLLTGESDIIYKNPGDTLYSGSYVVSGEGYCRVQKIGNDSYIQTLQSTAKQFKRSQSEILRSFKKLFSVILVLVTIVVAFMLITYGIQGKLGTEEAFVETIKPISASILSFVPAGLYLLVSVALTVSVITLARKHAHVQDFYAVEMLARSNVLCIDKTGTITDGTMNVKEIIPFGKFTNIEVTNLVGMVANAINDNNATANALKSVIYSETLQKPTTILNFTSENKYSAVSYSSNTYVIGAAEFIELHNSALVQTKVDEYAAKGLRVLVLCENKKGIKDNKVVGKSDAIAIITIQDHVKDDAIRTFKWFKDNGVAIKVISGDNAITTSEIAKQAGIEYSEKYISLEGMSLDEVKAVADKYTVFGRVTPEQKAAIVESLQYHNQKVAMTGDGVNDILALKKADCSIAMQSGSEAARNVSHIVMMDSNFASLPDVVGEGRRVINNLQRTSCLFLTKNIFAYFFTILFLIVSLVKNNPSIEYPFRVEHMYIWEILAIGISAFFIALEKNSEEIRGKFLRNVLQNAFPCAAMIIVPVLCIFGAYNLHAANIIYTGITSFDAAVSMAVLTFTILSFVVLFRVCLPFDKYRLIVFLSVFILSVVVLCIMAIISFNNPKGGEGTLLKICFEKLTGSNYLFVIVASIISAAIFFCIVAIDNNLRVKRKHEN